MKKLVIGMALAAGCWTWGSDRAEAAPPRRLGPPRLQGARSAPLSPYLNLLNENNNLETNYFLRADPQLYQEGLDQQFARSINGLDRDFQKDRRDRQLQSTNSNLRPTGHSTQFFSYGAYYNSRPGRGGGSR